MNIFLNLLIQTLFDLLVYEHNYILTDRKTKEKFWTNKPILVKKFQKFYDFFLSKLIPSIDYYFYQYIRILLVSGASRNREELRRLSKDACIVASPALCAQSYVYCTLTRLVNNNKKKVPHEYKQQQILSPFLRGHFVYRHSPARACLGHISTACDSYTVKPERFFPLFFLYNNIFIPCPCFFAPHDYTPRAAKERFIRCNVIQREEVHVHHGVTVSQGLSRAFPSSRISWLFLFFYSRTFQLRHGFFRFLWGFLHGISNFFIQNF